MARMAIVGSGQAGTLAAVGLMNAGRELTLYSDRTADSILNETPPTGTAILFGDSIAYQRKMGVETFEDRALLGYRMLDSTLGAVKRDDRDA